MKINLKKSLVIFLGTIVCTILLKQIIDPGTLFFGGEHDEDYIVALVYGFLVAIVFFLLYVANKNDIETQEEKLASNFIIYLNIYIISPLLVGFLGMVISDWLDLIFGIIVAFFVLFFATVVYYIRTAKNIVSTKIIIWRITAPFLWMPLLVLIYLAYFSIKDWIYWIYIA